MNAEKSVGVVSIATNVGITMGLRRINMKVLDAIYKRKSIRKFKNTLIPKEDIIELLNAGTHAPSPKHQQNWHFVVLQNRDIINKMADIVTKSHENIGKIAKNEKDFKRHMSMINYYTCFKHAPVVIIVYSCEYKILQKDAESEG